MEKIKVNSNVKQYLVVNEHDEEMGVIKVDMTDFEFFNRSKEAEKNITEIVKRMEQLQKQNLSMEETFEQLSVLDKEVKEQLDMLFDCEVSKVVFGNKNCLSVGNGEIFIVRFMKAVLPVIKRDIEKEQKKSVQKIAKYTKGYTK